MCPRDALGRLVDEDVPAPPLLKAACWCLRVLPGPELCLGFSQHASIKGHRFWASSSTRVKQACWALPAYRVADTDNLGLDT